MKIVRKWWKGVVGVGCCWGRRNVKGDVVSSLEVIVDDGEMVACA